MYTNIGKPLYLNASSQEGPWAEKIEQLVVKTFEKFKDRSTADEGAVNIEINKLKEAMSSAEYTEEAFENWFKGVYKKIMNKEQRARQKRSNKGRENRLSGNTARVRGGKKINTKRKTKKVRYKKNKKNSRRRSQRK